MAERKGKTRNFFVWIIMGLLFVGLMGFGATGLSGTTRSVGTVGEKPLSAQAYYRTLQQQMALQSQQAGRQISFPEAEADGLHLRALQIVVSERAIDNEASQMGLSVGDEVISQQLLGNPAFRGVDGTFDQEQYRETLARNGLSVREYETSLRDETSRALLQGAVFTGVVDPRTYAETLATFNRQERTFTWATLTQSDVEISLPEPSDADLQAQYDANPGAYTSLETRVIDYVWLTPEMLQDEVPVSEEELRAEYEARLEEYQQPERRLVERLVFADVAAAEAALAAIEAGETTFPALVEERGLALEDVDIGDVTEAQMAEAGPAIFAAVNGDVVGPFPSDLGPALFRMNAVLAAQNRSFEEVVDELREDQAAARARRMIEDQIDPIADLLAGGAGVAELADETDMQAGTIEWTVEVADGIAAYANFRDVAAATEVGDFAELEELEDGGLFSLEVREVRAPALIPLDDVRDQVIADWEAAQTAQAVLDEAEARAGRLREAVQDFTAVELAANVELGRTRNDFINGTPPGFVPRVFDMEPGEVQVVPFGGTAFILRLDSIDGTDTESEAFLAEVEQVSERAGEGVAQDIYEMFAREIQVQTDVNINDAAINAVHSNFR